MIFQHVRLFFPGHTYLLYGAKISLFMGLNDIVIFFLNIFISIHKNAKHTHKMHTWKRDNSPVSKLYFGPDPEVIKLFSCSTQLSTKFILLINVKMPTIVGILTFISMINTSYKRLKARNFFIYLHFSLYD